MTDRHETPINPPEEPRDQPAGGVPIEPLDDHNFLDHSHGNPANQVPNDLWADITAEETAPAPETPAEPHAEHAEPVEEQAEYIEPVEEQVEYVEPLAEHSEHAEPLPADEWADGDLVELELDDSAQATPPEPVEFGDGATEVDFDILHADEPAPAHPAGSAVGLGEPPSAVDSASSIFGDAGNVQPTAPGSGWFDAPRSGRHVVPPESSSGSVVGGHEPPRSGGSVDDLFGMLRGGPATPHVSVGSGWVKDEATGMVSESEVLKAFDQLHRTPPTSRVEPPSPASDALGSASPDFAATDSGGEGSNLFPQPDSDGYGADSGYVSDIDILDGPAEADTGTSRSSIFSGGGRADDATEPLSFDDVAEADDESSVFDVPPAAAGSSIFDKAAPASHWHDEDDATQADAATAAPVEAGIDWDDFVADDPDQVTMGVPRPGDDVDEIDAIFHPDGPTSPSLRPEHDLDPPDSASNFVQVEGAPSAAESGIIHAGTEGEEMVGMLVDPAGESGVIVDDGPASASYVAEKKGKKGAKKPAKAEASTAPKPARKKGGAGAWIGGGIAGVVLGAGGVAAAHFAGLLPEDSPKGVPLNQMMSASKDGEETKAALAKAEAAEKKAKADADEIGKKAKADAEATAVQLREQIDAAAKAKMETDAAELKLRESAAAVTKAMTDADTAKTAAAKAEADLKAAMTAADRAKDDLKAAVADADKAKDDLKAAKLDGEKVAKDLVDSKKMLEEKLKAVTDAEALAVEAEKKRKAADDALAAVVKELKANKLIPDGDEPAAALAKVPDALKAAGAAMTSADQKKAAEALTQAGKDLAAAKANLGKAEEAVTAAKAEAKDALAAAEKAKGDAAKMVADAKKETDDKVAAAVAKEAAANKARVDEANAAAAAAEAKRTADAAAAEARRKEDEARHARDLQEARSGTVVQLTSPEQLAVTRSVAAYGKGVEAFFAGRHADAEKLLAAAAADNPGDARNWYFLGLSQFQQDKTADAAKSFKRGADQEKNNSPPRAVVNDDLSRIQGPMRRELGKYRP